MKDWTAIKEWMTDAGWNVIGCESFVNQPTLSCANKTRSYLKMSGKEGI